MVDIAYRILTTERLHPSARCQIESDGASQRNVVDPASIAFAVDEIAAAGAVEVVITRAAEQRIVARAAMEMVVAAAATEPGAGIGGVESVVAIAGGDLPDIDQGIRIGPVGHRAGSEIHGSVDDRRRKGETELSKGIVSRRICIVVVKCPTADERIVAVAAEQDVAEPSFKPVIAVAAPQNVTSAVLNPLTPIEEVVSFTALEPVAILASIECIVAKASLEIVKTTHSGPVPGFIYLRGNALKPEGITPMSFSLASINTNNLFYIGG